MDLHAVILAGGQGERFWPLSRRGRPKQLLALTGGETLFESTLARISWIPPERTWIVAGSELRAAFHASPRQLPPAQYIWEPIGRNTAAAIGAGAESVLARSGDADLLVLPSDHWIPSAEALRQTVEAGRAALDRVPLVTFGIRAAYPETGYGYIQRGDPIDEALGAWRVQRFHEKPDAARAEAYCASGFYWNSGIFLFRASAIAAEMRVQIPEMAPVLDRLRSDLAASGEPGGEAGAPAWLRYFQDSPSVSIDYGVMERAPEVAVVEARFPWNDLGCWTSWGDLVPADAAGNRTQGEVLTWDTKDSILFSEDGGLLAVLGLENVIVVRVGDATLVCAKDRAQEVRRLVREGKANEALRRFF